MRGVLALAALAATGWLSGCGENCRSTCTHVYAQSECAIPMFGQTAEKMIARCTDECETAMQHVGEPMFDPMQTPANDETVELTNEAEAAAWIDCVWTQAPEDGPSAACANIDPREGGICGPI